MVNWLDIDVEKELAELEDKDKLEAILEMVEELEKSYDWTTEADIHTAEGQEYTRKLLGWAQEELWELSNELKDSRPWVDTDTNLDVNHCLDELADSLLFLLVVVNKFDLSAEDLLELLLRKKKVNHMRGKTNY